MRSKGLKGEQKPLLSPSILPFYPLIKNPTMSRYSSIPLHLLISSALPHHVRRFSRSSHPTAAQTSNPSSSTHFVPLSPANTPVRSLPHLTPKSTIHVIPITAKPSTPRSALAVGHIVFSNPTPLPMVRSHALKKGDVLAVARVAGIMAVKRTSDLIPLCHSGVPVEGISVNVEVVDGEVAPGQPPEASESALEKEDGEGRELTLPLPPHGGVRISVRVDTTAKTGVEMEALAGVVGAGLTVIDMCKSVDRGLRMDGVSVAWKNGGESGGWGIDGERGKGLKRKSIGV